MPILNVKVSAKRTAELSERITEKARLRGQDPGISPPASRPMKATSMELTNVIVATAMRRAGLASWIPEGEGKWSLPLQFLPDGSGWVELMRLKPGVRLGLHRHTDEVHALTLAGARRLNDGRVVQAGDYIHEPAGNVDWWEAIGDEDLLVHVVVKGAVEYLGPHHSVLRRIAAADRVADYRAHCAAIGSQPLELG